MASTLFNVLSRCSLSNLKTSRLLIGRVCSRSMTSASEGGDKEGAKESSAKEGDDSVEEELKARILDAALSHVPTHGWSTKAIIAGAEDAGFPGSAHGLFPKGAFDLVHHFYQVSNSRLAESLKGQAELVEKDPLLKRSEREVAEAAVESRLRMIVPYLSSWPQAMAIMTLPHNATVALADLLTLVDDICYYAGDRSVDMNWYSKRLGLALVYKMTELYLVQDSSEDHAATWAFLHRRMTDAAHVHQVVTSSDLSVNFTKELGTAAFITARNILGMNWNR